MPKVGVIMGSVNDLSVMQETIDILEVLNVACEKQVVSAHRTPEEMFEYARKARKRGINVIIAGAGGAAHLPGMVASITTLPVIGVPIQSKSLKGMDSLLSIVQMPAGVPVATMAINGAKNAGILAAEILALSDSTLLERLEKYRQDMHDKVIEGSKL